VLVPLSPELKGLASAAARAAGQTLTEWTRQAMRARVLSGSPVVPPFAGEDAG
jgi:predicted HicB family RNase H-like nuclease